MNNYYNQWINIEFRHVRTDASYYQDYDWWRSNPRIHVLENDIYKFDFPTERQSGHMHYQIFSGILNPYNNGWTFTVPHFDSPSLISAVDIRSTKIETCDKCAAGAHNCVQNAMCTDRNKAHNFEGMVDCECRPGFIGSGEYRCRDCNHRFNCMRLRSGCGGSYPVDFSKSSLLTCLASHSDDVLINNVAYTKDAINGVRNGANFQFYKGPTEFIYFDKEYQEWRIGGSMAPTRSVDCSTVDIC